MSKKLSKDKQKKMILSNNLWKVMFDLSWPAVIAMVLYGLNTVFDALFVGRFVGEIALAGVSIAYPLSQLTLGIGSMIGVGAGSALSIALGAKDKKTQRQLMGNVNYLSLITTIFFMVIGLAFSSELVKVMGGEGKVLALGDSYFRITIFGSLFWIYGLADNMIVRAEGKMKSAAVMMGFGLVVNIIANYILVGIMNLGVEGAAWGTNLGMFIYTLAGWIYFGKGFSSFKTKVLTIKRDKDIIKSILSMGIPSLIMQVMNLVQAVLIFNALSKYGTSLDIAFYGVTFRIFTFLLTPIFGLMRALQPVIGINYGAKQNNRVISSFKIFAFAATILILPFWLFAMFSPTSVISIMMPGQTFSAGMLNNFRIYMALLPILPVIFMGMTFFPAIDKGKIGSIIGIVRQLFLYVPVMLIVPRIFGVSGVYYGSFGVELLVILLTVFLVKKEFNLLRNSGELGNLAKNPVN